MGEGAAFASAESRRRYDALVRASDRTVVGLDFDGTLSPIVDDPAEAGIHPDAAAALVVLAEQVRAIAVITGRPAQQVLSLGGLDEVGDALVGHGTDLYVFGQYGNERWSTASREIHSPPPPPGLEAFLEELPDVLAQTDTEDAWIEQKGIAVAVHTRRLPDAAAARDRLLQPIRELASRHGLVTEPGRNVVEVRADGKHKGDAVHTLAGELDAGGFLFAGDDLGDVQAFDAVGELAKQGMPTLLVCSASEEEGSALVDRADVVVPGPDGVLDLLRRLADDAASRVD